MKCNAVLLVFARSCCELVGRNMRLAVLGADAAAGSAADAAAGIIDNHDHAIELAVEIIVLVIAGAEDFTRIINAVKMHDIARADLETTAAADAGLLSMEVRYDGIQMEPSRVVNVRIILNSSLKRVLSWQHPTRH